MTFAIHGSKNGESVVTVRIGPDDRNPKTQETGGPTPGFPAKSNTLWRRFLPISQADLHSSRTTG